MARLVGCIEVLVDADTGTLVAKLRTAGTTAGKAMAKEIDKQLAKVNGDQLLRRIIAIRGSAEFEPEGIRPRSGPASASRPPRARFRATTEASCPHRARTVPARSEDQSVIMVGAAHERDGRNPQVTPQIEADQPRPGSGLRR